MRNLRRFTEHRPRRVWPRQAADLVASGVGRRSGSQQTQRVRRVDAAHSHDGSCALLVEGPVHAPSQGTCKPCASRRVASTRKRDFHVDQLADHALANVFKCRQSVRRHREPFVSLRVRLSHIAMGIGRAIWFALERSNAGAAPTAGDRMLSACPTYPRSSRSFRFFQPSTSLSYFSARERIAPSGTSETDDLPATVEMRQRKPSPFQLVGVVPVGSQGCGASGASGEVSGRVSSSSSSGMTSGGAYGSRCMPRDRRWTTRRCRAGRTARRDVRRARAPRRARRAKRA
jgi:hypothetical protein